MGWAARLNTPELKRAREVAQVLWKSAQPKPSSMSQSEFNRLYNIWRLAMDSRPKP